MSVSLRVRYPAGHYSHEEVWVATDYFCPACGSKSVWQEYGAGDYYVGPAHLCVACDASFLLPGGIERDGPQKDMNKQRLDTIRKQST